MSAPHHTATAPGVPLRTVARLPPRHLTSLLLLPAGLLGAPDGRNRDPHETLHCAAVLTRSLPPLPSPQAQASGATTRRPPFSMNSYLQGLQAPHGLELSSGEPGAAQSQAATGQVSGQAGEAMTSRAHAKSTGEAAKRAVRPATGAAAEHTRGAAPLVPGNSGSAARGAQRRPSYQAARPHRRIDVTSPALRSPPREPTAVVMVDAKDLSNLVIAEPSAARL